MQGQYSPKAMPKPKVYAIRKGKQTGIFHTWLECEAQVKGFPGAQFKSFNTVGEAETYLGIPRGNTTTTTTAGSAAAAALNQRRYEPYSGLTQSRSQSAQESPSPAQVLAKPEKPDPRAVISKCQATAMTVEDEEGLEIQCTPQAYTMNFDGGSRGNPGLAGSGACISETATGKKIIGLACPLPYGCTNNEAEYGGLILGLQACVLLGIQAPLVKGDSKLVVMQVNGEWKVNAQHLLPYYDAACALLDSLRAGDVLAEVKHVYREQNTEADRLSNVAIDMQL